MILTIQSIHALFNLGCPNAPQKNILGLPAKLKAGWIQDLDGKEIADELYEKLIALKGPRPRGVNTKEWKEGKISPQKPKTATLPVECEEWL